MSGEARSFLRGVGRVFSFGLVRSDTPAPLTPERQIELAFATLDAAVEPKEKTDD